MTPSGGLWKRLNVQEFWWIRSEEIPPAILSFRVLIISSLFNSSSMISLALVLNSFFLFPLSGALASKSSSSSSTLLGSSKSSLSSFVSSFLIRCSFSSVSYGKKILKVWTWSSLLLGSFCYSSPLFPPLSSLGCSKSYVWRTSSGISDCPQGALPWI